MNRTDRPSLDRPSRREFLALGVGIFAVTAIPLVRGRRPRLVRRSVPLMGTLADVGVVHENPAYAHAAIDAALHELRLVERRMSRFDPLSDIGRVNRLAAADAVDVSPATATVLEAAIGWAIASDGAFDPCLGRASELWDVGHRTVPPRDGDVRRLAGRHLYRALDVERGPRCRVRLTAPDAAIDLGGIAKGFGVDRAVDALRRWGIERGLVNVGGDLYAVGCSADGDPWRVGIRSPANPDRLAGTLEVADAAVATSGDYERFFRYGGRRYHHLLDPTTAAPRQAALHSVTVQAPTCLAADAAATAIFGQGDAAAGHILRRGDVAVVRVGVA